MSGLAIMKPLPMAVSSGGGPNINNVLTPSPREIWTANAANVEQLIIIDMGVPAKIDCLYLGGTNADAATTWRLFKTDDAVGLNITAVFLARPIRLVGAVKPPYNTAILLSATVTSRYFYLYCGVGQTSAPLQIGNLAMGLAFSHPYAFGSGRAVVDMSRRTPFIDGGFGVEEGAVKSTLRWQFVDLEKPDLDTLYQIAIDCGSSQPIVVIEDVPFPTQTAPEAAMVHYGLFDRLEAFERLDPRESRWSMSMEEWR